MELFLGGNWPVASCRIDNRSGGMNVVKKMGKGEGWREDEYTGFLSVVYAVVVYSTSYQYTSDTYASRINFVVNRIMFLWHHVQVERMILLED